VKQGTVSAASRISTQSMDEEKPRLELSVGRRLLVLLVVVVSSATYIAATFTATAILPQMQGAVAATQDEISWTVTFNILATAIVTPMSGWLVARFGTRAVLFWSLIGFSVATFLCGAAHSLETLVLWRMLQGAAGAPLIPLGQTVLFDVFPRRQHATVISLFGMSNTFGPVIGPTLGGYLAEYYSWRWAYYMLVPVALAACVGALLALPRDTPDRPVSLDWVGFLSLSVAIAAVQLVLARGQRLDWFESGEIIVETIVAIIALYVFIAHTVTAKTPFLSPRLVLDRNYAIGLVLISIFGMLNFTPMVLLPPLLQGPMALPDSLVGIVVSWRGIGVLAGFFAAMFTNRVDPRVGMVLGFGMQIVSGLWLMSMDLNAHMLALSANAFLQGLAVGLIWTPIVTSSFLTLDAELRPEGVAVLHLMRNIMSSFFISVSVAEVVRATSANYGRMTEFVTPYNKVLTTPSSSGAWSFDTLPGLASFAKEITRQAAMIGYLNAFYLYTAASVAAIPLVLLVSTKQSKPA
jgi:MFS transporter, DHA2 family, multidrug resistance protein